MQVVFYMQCRTLNLFVFFLFFLRYSQKTLVLSNSSQQEQWTNTHTHTHFQEGPCLDLVTPVVSKWRKGRITTNISCDPQIMIQYQEDTTGYQKKTRLQKRHHCWERLPRQNDVIYLHEVCTVYLRKKILYIHIYHDRWWIMNHDGINT